MFYEFLIQLFNFYDFKKQLVVSYIKMISLFYLIDYANMEQKKCSKLLDLEVQLLTSDELSYFLFTQHFKETENLFYQLERVLEGILKTNNPYTFFNIFRHLNSVTERPLCLTVFIIIYTLSI